MGMEWDAQYVELDDGMDYGDDDEGGVGEGEEGGGAATEGERGPVDLWGQETWDETVAKWLFCGDDRNTKMVFVRGRLVHERR